MDDQAFRSGVVAIIGPPNAGKSTLLNRLLGQKIAAVTPRPQTTRNRILGIVNGPGYQMILLDTPGLHKPKERLNKEMVRIALESLAEADLILYLIDGTIDAPEILARRSDEFGRYLGEENGSKTLLAINKIDLMEPGALQRSLSWHADLYPFADIVPISALRGDGVDELVQKLASRLPEGPQYYPEDMPTDASERFIVAEMIREQIFLLLKQEVPYSTAVLIDRFVEPSAEGRPVIIHASILVERSSQKGILIGHRGSMLAKIREAASREISHLLGCPVQLHLWVKVRKKWTANPQILKELGL